MPNFAKALRTSHFSKLQTTMPPQSPVAWASFISGTNPGGHGIFDFIHRDPKAFIPYLSTSRSFDASHELSLGNWSLPLTSGHIELMRKGRPFWSYLEEQDIPSTIYQIPSNFPTQESPTKAVSGMGTPDLLGTYGTFTFFSEAFVPGSDNFSGGRVVRLRLEGHKTSAKLGGPKNSFRKDGEETFTEVSFTRDPIDPLVKISVQDHTLLMKAGEWSNWIPLRFEYVPHLVSAAGMVRFFVKEVHPKLKVYCSPINVDPMEPALPIGSPAGYTEEMARAVGRFYTQGLPADTKALSLRVLDDEDFFAQAKLVLEESIRAFEYGIKNFDEGVFFFYFSSIDQCSHMLMRAMDVNHPLYNPNASPEIKNAIRYLYGRMDEVLGKAFEHVDSRTILAALSDHGFSKFYREFHLSTWLVQQGFTVLTDPSKMEESHFFDYVDWNKTTAYALGFNGIYLNLMGRDKYGSLRPEQAQAIKADIIRRLPEARDPKTGARVIVNAYDSADLYSGPYRELAPDVLVGYDAGYRASDESVLGKFKKELVGDRTDKWSADHCIDNSVVPGMFLMNRECSAGTPAIWDLAPTILRAFSIKPPDHMHGVNLIRS
jgi:predicted AlkP superfamily phosphohydrolase/phosphomutase